MINILTRREFGKGLASILASGVMPNLALGSMRRGIGKRIATTGGAGPYTFIESVYFQGNSTQCYLNTGFYANTTTTRFVGAFSADTISSFAVYAVLGARASSSTSSTALQKSTAVYINKTPKLRLDWSHAQTTYYGSGLTFNEKFTIDITRPTAIVNETTYTSTVTYSYDQPVPFFIGNVADGSEKGISSGFMGKVYECWLYSNNVIVRHYLPCVRNEDGAVGFWEELNDTFQTNSLWSLPS